MATSPGIDRQTFLAYLRQSGLVSDEQLAGITRRFIDQPRGRPVAGTLVQDGVLTRFQAERLLMGRTAGFLLGQHRILEQIGRGGMGRVYKAEHRTMHRIVALKVLAPDLVATERAVEMFRHEAQAIAQLVHPNIVTAFDASEVNGRYYLALEYVDGPNLEQLVRKQGLLSVGLACDYICQAANGLQCAHARGMVHRDLKPANILVQRQGFTDDSPGLVKISDFGLARLAAPVGSSGWHRLPTTIFTRDNTVMGTPDYLSPEQSRNLHKVDIRSDLYSLGCTFYYLLTGSVPFPDGNAMDKLIRHATEQAAPISEFRSDVPAPVQAIVAKLMAKHPNDRFQTPADLALALQPYAVSGPTPWAFNKPPSSDSLPSETEEPTACGSDGEMALTNTISSDHAPTPAPATQPPSRQIKRRPTSRNNRLKVAVLAATAVVTGLVAAIAVLSLFFK